MLRPRPHLFALLATAASLFGQTPTATTAIPNQSLGASSAPATVDLKQHFNFTGTTGPIALFETVLGDFNVELQNTAAPKHVENFTAYANERWYDWSFLHRSSSLESQTGTTIPDITKAPKVLQGGAYILAGTNDGGTIRQPITQKAAVALEYSLPNTRGTLAAARSNDVNSATSQWFFNVADNTTPLGQTNGVGGYTVFGKVLGSGMEVIDAMAAVKRFRYSDQFNEMPLRNYESGPVGDAHLVLFERVRVVPIYPPDAQSPGVLRFEATTSSSGIVEASVAGSTLSLTPRAPGSATITVRALDARNTAATATFTVQITPNAPIVSAMPRSQTIAPGGSASFSVTATGSGTLAYQWRKGGTAIAGATGASLALANVTAADAGDYSVAITDANGTTITRNANLRVEAPAPGGLMNLSVRAGTQPLIVGFVTSGGSKPFLIRAIGPTLGAFGITTPLADPKLELHQSVGGQDTVLASNDDWGSNAGTLVPAFTAAGAFPLPNPASKDAAMIAPLNGLGTAVVTAASGPAGVVLTELYDLNPGSGARLVNVSARARVGTYDNVVIAGFVINGNMPKRVLIRGVGPTLGTKFAVAGALANPRIELHTRVNDQDTVIASNDDWHTDPEVVAAPPVGFALDANSADAALALTLPAGAYSVHLQGFSGTSGEVLIEVYELP